MGHRNGVHKLRRTFKLNGLYTALIDSQQPKSAIYR